MMRGAAEKQLGRRADNDQLGPPGRIETIGAATGR
jgi:hypothetical protein